MQELRPQSLQRQAGLASESGGHQHRAGRRCRWSYTRHGGVYSVAPKELSCRVGLCLHGSSLHSVSPLHVRIRDE